MELERKILPFEVKASPGNGNGSAAAGKRTIEGMASTSAVDMMNDIVEPNAFRTWLADWKKGGNPLPLIDQHNLRSVTGILGRLTDARITRTGLWTKFEVAPTTRGKEALALVEGGYVNGLSIGYRVRDAENDTDGAGNSVRRITDIDLREVSLVIWPANDTARVSGTGKADEDGSFRLSDPKRLEAQRIIRDIQERQREQVRQDAADRRTILADLEHRQRRSELEVLERRTQATTHRLASWQAEREREERAAWQSPMGPNDPKRLAARRIVSDLRRH